MSKGRLSGEGRPKPPPLSEPPPWVKVNASRPTKGFDGTIHPLIGQVVPTAGRDWGSLIPAIFVKSEDGTEYLVFDNDWETP